MARTWRRKDSHLDASKLLRIRHTHALDIECVFVLRFAHNSHGRMWCGVTKYEKFLDRIHREHVRYREEEIAFPVNGLYIRGRRRRPLVVVRESLSSDEKLCVAAEEMGHHFTSSGNLLYVTPREYERQEWRAKKWAYENLVKLDDLGAAYTAGYRCLHSMAFRLDVSSEFLEDAILFYRDLYGVEHHTRRYTFQFIPTFSVSLNQ